MYLIMDTFHCCRVRFPYRPKSGKKKSPNKWDFPFRWAGRGNLSRRKFAVAHSLLVLDSGKSSLARIFRRSLWNFPTEKFL